MLDQFYSHGGWAKIAKFIEIDGKRFLWHDLLQKRREQRQAMQARTEQPALFDLREDCRPPTERTAADRYLQPSLFTHLDSQPQ